MSSIWACCWRIILGGLASYGVGGIAPRDNGNDDIVLNASSYNVSYVLANPNLNPFDITVGQRHNEILKDLIIMDNFDYTGISNCISSEISLSSEELNYYNNNPTFFLNGYNLFFSIENMNTQTINDAGATISSNTLLLEVLNNYCEGLSLVDYSNVMGMSPDYEEYIINSSLLNVTTKQSSLVGVSAGKYSSKFWYDNL